MYINTLKSYFPEEIIDNHFFEKIMDTSDEWITSRVGIKERRRYQGENATTVLGVNAVRQLPKDALNDLDCIIAAPSVMQWQCPATANLIAKELEIDEVPCFDLRALCSSFVFGAKVMQGLLATGYKKILFILPEAFSGVIDYTDRSTSILMGDGAVAMILSNEPSGFEVIDSLINSKSSGAYSVTIPVNGHFKQEGNKVQTFAVRYSIKASQELLTKNGLSVKDIDYLILHQANLVMINSVGDNLGFKREQLLQNIVYYGNTAAVGSASVLAENWDRIQPGQKVLVTVVGAGLSWGSMLLKKIA